MFKKKKKIEKLIRLTSRMFLYIVKWQKIFSFSFYPLHFIILYFAHTLKFKHSWAHSNRRNRKINNWYFLKLYLLHTLLYRSKSNRTTIGWVTFWNQHRFSTSLNFLLYNYRFITMLYIADRYCYNKIYKFNTIN